MSRQEALEALGSLIREGAPTGRLEDKLSDLNVDLRHVQDDLFFMAVVSDKVEVLEWLGYLPSIRQGLKDERGKGPLLLAVEHRCPKAIRWLMDECAYVHIHESAEDDGLTPLVKAVREQYVEGVATIVDANSQTLNSAMSIGSGEDNMRGVACAIVDAYQEALSLREGAGKNANKRLGKICKMLERALRICALGYARFDLLDLPKIKENDQEKARGLDGSESKTKWVCLKAEVVGYFESRRWWPRFLSQAGSLERTNEEIESEAELLRAAIEAAQPAIVDWLLGTWRVDFDACQHYLEGRGTVSDIACAAEVLEEEVRERRLAQRYMENKEKDCKEEGHGWIWNLCVDGWLIRSAGNPIRVSGLFEETKQRLKAAENDYEQAEVLKSRLRLLAKDGTYLHLKAMDMLEILISRFNERAVPSLDLLVKVAGAWHPFKWLLEQGLIDLKAPLAEPQESDGEEDGDEEVEVCSICVSAMPNPVLRCRLECGHQLCRRCARELFSFNSDAGGQAPSRWPCPMCREEVPPPRIVHGDIMLRLRESLPWRAPWLFPDCLPPDEELTGLALGPVLLGLAFGWESLVFAEELVLDRGMDPFSRIGGRTMACIAVEERRLASLAWLCCLAEERGCLAELVGSCNEAGHGLLEVAVEAGFEAGVRFIVWNLNVPNEAKGVRWIDSALESEVEGIRQEAQQVMASVVLGGGGAVERGLRDGWPVEKVVEELGRHNALRAAVDAYQQLVIESFNNDSLRGETGYIEGSQLYDFVFNKVVRWGRADVLRWFLLHGPHVHDCHRRDLNFRFVHRGEVCRAAERWGLGSDLPPAFAAACDEAESLAEAKDMAQTHRKEFGRLISNGCTLQEAQASIEAFKPICDMVPKELHTCTLLGGDNKYNPLQNPATAPIIHTDCHGYSPLCKAAKGSGWDLVKWLAQCNACCDDLQCGRTAAVYFKALAVAAHSGNLDVVKAAWNLLKGNDILEDRYFIFSRDTFLEVCECSGCRNANDMVSGTSSGSSPSADEGDCFSAWRIVVSLMDHALGHACHSKGSWDGRTMQAVIEWMCSRPEVTQHQAILEGVNWQFGTFWDDDSSLSDVATSDGTAGSPEEDCSRVSSEILSPGGTLALWFLRLIVTKHGVNLHNIHSRCNYPLGETLVGEEIGKRHSNIRGRTLRECLPWLVIQQGVNIQTLTAFRFSSDGKPGKALFVKLQAEQRKRFDLADSIIRDGYSASGDKREKQVDLGTLRDRYGRMLLKAAIADKRPKEVINSIMLGLREQQQQDKGANADGND